MSVFGSQGAQILLNTLGLIHDTEAEKQSWGHLQFEDLFTISVKLHILYACKHMQASSFFLDSNHISVNFDLSLIPYFGTSF